MLVGYKYGDKSRGWPNNDRSIICIVGGVKTPRYILLIGRRFLGLAHLTILFSRVSVAAFVCHRLLARSNQVFMLTSISTLYLYKCNVSRLVVPVMRQV